MNEKYLDFPRTPDQKYSDLRNPNGDLPQEYWTEFIHDYSKVWAYWQKSIEPFCPRPLWTQGAPGFREEHGQPQPSVGVRIHEGVPRGMVLVCAGGGFVLKANFEGPAVADRFYQDGFNVAVLDYRVTPFTRQDAVADAKRAIRYLRYYAAQLNTLPDKIAICGFSAGGFLTNMAATTFDDGDKLAEDPVERISCRPDAAIPCYGSFSRAAWPSGNLNYNRRLQQELVTISPDCYVNADCPPFFIWQCADRDDPRNALNLATRLTIYGIPFELHLFPYGGHGIGLADGQCLDPNGDDPHVGHWVELCVEWLKQMKF